MARSHTGKSLKQRNTGALTSKEVVHIDKAKYCDIFYDGKAFPITSCSVDKVISNQVLEHVFTQDLFISEIHRILKPGGLLLLSVPFVWDEHETPYDYIRYTSFGIRHFLINNGFEITEQLKNTSYLETVFQMLSAYVALISSGLNKYIRAPIIVFLCSVIQLIGIIASKVLSRREDFYLDNIVLAVKKEK